MKVKILLFCSILLLLSCKTYISATTQAEIEKAVTAYMSQPHPKRLGTTSDIEPSAKVHGMRISRNDSTYRINVDAELPSGERVSRTVRCAEFTKEGKTYWKVEPLY